MQIKFSGGIYKCRAIFAGLPIGQSRSNAIVMISIFAPSHRAAAVLAAAVFAVAGAAAPAQAQVRLKTHYVISMTGVSVGQIVWFLDIDARHYTASANGKASGVLSVLVNGEGSVVTQGVVLNGRPAPSSFTSNITDDEGKSELRMTFERGVVKEVVTQEPPPTADRVPITNADRRGVSDPLSAMLIPVKAGDDALSTANCNRVLAIFDGRRRYDLELSFKRVDQVTIERGFSGPVLVCGVVLQPKAGYRADSTLVKYVAGRRNMELWFAPISGTSIIAPVRVLMPTLIGTLKIQADQFEAGATPAPVTPPSVTSPVVTSPR
jgi:Protein of unknown function (DUF3108)